MNKNILNYIEECEAWKVGIKNLHWSADNLSQHELCDDIADEISNFEDLVSEVEQSISGKIELNGFKPKSYKIVSLKSFVEDVISSSQEFLKKLGKMGDRYIGIKSECESFIGVMQRKLYLVNFTLKEELKRRLRAQLREGYRKEENIKTVFRGNDPTTDNGITKRLEAISKNGQFNSRVFASKGDAFDFIARHLEKVGSLHSIGNVDDVFIVQFDANNGKSYKGMLHFMEVGDGQYKASLKFSNLGKDGEEDVDPELSEPTIEDDYDNELSNGYRMENRDIRLTESELKQVIKEAAMKILFEKKGIKIAKEKEGTFTREATKHGKSPKEFAKQVLSNPNDYSPKMRKKANFCNNFAK